MNLESFGINQLYINKLRRSGIRTAEELLILPISKLHKMFHNVKISEIKHLISEVSNKICPKSHTVNNLIKHPNTLNNKV